MSIGSPIITFAGLVCLGAVVAFVYIVLMRRGQPAAAGRSPVGRAAAPAAAGPITVEAIVARLVGVGDEESIFLDRDRRQFVTLGDALLGDLQSNEPIEDLIDDESKLGADQLAALRTALKIGVLIPLPTKAETKEFILREKFCDGLPEGETKQQMLKVLRGQTGFRSFEGAVERLGIDREWTEYRDAHFTEIATAWLRKHDIKFQQSATSDQPSESHQQKKPAA